MHWGFQKARLSLMQRKPNSKSCSASDLALQFNPAAMSTHNSLDDHQTEAGALLLGGVEGFENAIYLLLGNSAAGIGNANPNAVVTFARLQGQRSAPGHGL